MQEQIEEILSHPEPKREVHLSTQMMERVLTLHHRCAALTQNAEEAQQRAQAAQQVLVETITLVLEAQGITYGRDDRYTIDMAASTLRLVEREA